MLATDTGPVLDYIKWTLTLTKEKNNTASEQGKFHLATPEVHLLALSVMGKLVGKLSEERVLEITPGVSSVASKVLSGDIKSSAKVKELFAEIWMKGMLYKVFKTTKTNDDPKSI